MGGKFVRKTKEFFETSPHLNRDGGTKVVKLNTNTVPATNLGQQSYYRYHVNWGIAIATLAVTAFALVITTIKIGRAMFDLAFHQLFAMFTAATDLTGGQRLKKVLVEIASTFAVIFVMMVLLRMFIIYAQWANDMEQHIGIIGTILLLIAGAWALIDAPDIVQRLLGIDAGLRSGWQAMMGGYAAGRMVGAGGKMTAEAGGKALKAGGKIGGGAVAGGTGMTRALKNNSHVKPMPSHRHAGSPRQEGQFSTSMPNGNAPRYENNGEVLLGKDNRLTKLDRHPSIRCKDKVNNRPVLVPIIQAVSHHHLFMVDSRQNHLAMLIFRHHQR
ncbi:pLS20_p028 family conjugation system transmembrane protein [Lentibacillus amyloliquefaciens]|uniref:pLS20_p028 family conjugation system transmembrane protein n=1 Tax=Lentibacillus amyloliquefaciens TaxID=1472767 RepID=UPI001F428F4B|nr:hypothetical protein [Lentibacillus amyloliquefaciens]